MIPWALIAVGGLMIYSGVHKPFQSPLEIIKSILTNTPIPTDTTTNAPTTGGSGGTPNKPTI